MSLYKEDACKRSGQVKEEQLTLFKGFDDDPAGVGPCDRITGSQGVLAKAYGAIREVKVSVALFVQGDLEPPALFKLRDAEYCILMYGQRIVTAVSADHDLPLVMTVILRE